MPTVHASAALEGALRGGGAPPTPRDEGPVAGLKGTRLLRGVLTPAECAAVLAAAEAAGFERAALYTRPDGTDVYDARRQSARACIDAPGFAAALWGRVRRVVPARHGADGADAVGLNERARVLRYDPGDGFAPHADAPFRRADGRSREESRITLLLYLDAGYAGGRTTFHASRADAAAGVGVAVEPTPGAVLLQEQHLLHSVPPLERGRKHVLRTEVMYASPRG
jgi:prolyl 4-hydroxylase